jgi:hypothetical protein
VTTVVGNRLPSIKATKWMQPSPSCEPSISEIIMRLAPYAGLALCLALLQGCFDSPDKSTTKGNNDGTPSSVQMQKPDQSKDK